MKTRGNWHESNTKYVSPGPFESMIKSFWLSQNEMQEYSTGYPDSSPLHGAVMLTAIWRQPELNDTASGWRKH